MLKAKRFPGAANGHAGSRMTNWWRGNLPSESEHSRLRSGPQENAKNPRNQARRASKLLQKLQTGPGRRTTPRRESTMPPGEIKQQTGRRANKVPLTDLEWAVKGHGNRLRHQEPGKNLQSSIENVAREGMACFPRKMNQKSPKLRVKKIHGGQPPFVSWRKRKHRDEAQLDSQSECIFDWR